MKLIISFVLVAILCAGAAGGGVWWFYLSKPHAASEEKVAVVEEKSAEKGHKYLTLEKVIVMLLRNPGETESHYLSADLVVATTDKKEKVAKENLPLLRSIAVKSLSGYPLDKVAAMTVDQIAEQLNHAFEAHYLKEKTEKPFSEVMIGKLIIE